VQSVYLASELNASGIHQSCFITAVGLKALRVPTHDLLNVRLALGSTICNTLREYLPVQVLWGPGTLSSTALSRDSWKWFEFKEPYPYDGKSNLLVDYSRTDSRDPGRCLGTVLVRETNQEARTLYGRKDEHFPHFPFSVSSGTCTAVLGIMIRCSSPVCFIPPEVSMTLLSAPKRVKVQVSFDGSSFVSLSQVDWQTGGEVRVVEVS